ncbi:hypothetical protein BV22DRAFT_122533 [Leucogyrophana mollusca]|uniref:Uncharacterized protein n=1 Tax=Leucogyrophana mollusca TaxID=85980 RepID=A0ACB8BY38_9AGAM|nr:hypothetical protein BV22DRAFT_122533 [Leucogyrophana mollusca]
MVPLPSKFQVPRPVTPKFRVLILAALSHRYLPHRQVLPVPRLPMDSRLILTALSRRLLPLAIGFPRSVFTFASFVSLALKVIHYCLYAPLSFGQPPAYSRQPPASPSPSSQPSLSRSPTTPGQPMYQPMFHPSAPSLAYLRASSFAPLTPSAHPPRLVTPLSRP